MLGCSKNHSTNRAISLPAAVIILDGSMSTVKFLSSNWRSRVVQGVKILSGFKASFLHSFTYKMGYHSSSYLSGHGEVTEMCAQYAQNLGIPRNNFIAIFLVYNTAT